MKVHIWLLTLFLAFGAVSGAQADVLVRWDQAAVPSRDSLGISSLLIPATNGDGVRAATEYGYRVFLEVEADTIAAFVPPVRRVAGIVLTGGASAAQISLLRKRLGSDMRVLVAEERGKWPHIRLNWVTKRNDVLQVSSRTAQPWIENNAALIRIARAAQPVPPPLLAYAWQPITLADADGGPTLENYLVAIAEAGTFGADLVLPLHEGFQTELLLGRPAARAWWDEIRRYIEFYSWNLPQQYRPVANIGVIADNPMAHFEIHNLLLRHNLPLELMPPAGVVGRDLSPFQLLVVLDQPAGDLLQALVAFADRGGLAVIVTPKGPLPWHREPPAAKAGQHVTYAVGKGRIVEVLTPVVDPNAFALDIRQLLGADTRVLDIWNGISVLTAPYEDPRGKGVLLTMLNYAHQALPVQLRVRGAYSLVHYETPEQPPALLPHQHRNGYTEFVLPALRVGGRVFLSDETGH